VRPASSTISISLGDCDAGANRDSALPRIFHHSRIKSRGDDHLGADVDRGVNLGGRSHGACNGQQVSACRHDAQGFNGSFGTEGYFRDRQATGDERFGQWLCAGQIVERNHGDHAMVDKECEGIGGCRIHGHTLRNYHPIKVQPHFVIDHAADSF
jgi:hypothetical protein